MTWHDFQAVSADDHACAFCGVIAEDRVVDLIAVSCPVSPCDYPSNEGTPCVFVAGDDGPECSYCGRRGCLDSAGSSGEDDPDVSFGIVEADLERELGKEHP